MAKKYPIGYIKDPKKVAAGKARAAKSIRIKGQFVKPDFVKEVELLSQASGVNDAFKYFLQNEKMLTEKYFTMEEKTNRNADQIRMDVKKYKGKIIKNGKTVKAGTVVKAIAELGQYLENEHDLYNIFYLRPSLSMDGRMTINIPSVAEVRRRIEEGEYLEDIMNEYEIGIMKNDGTHVNEI
jgi:hypothetical protein